MRKYLHVAAKQVSRGERARQREEFRGFLVKHRWANRRWPLRRVLARYGNLISLSSAYRIAVAVNVRGKRHNQSRYDEFWKTINWRLPDNTLSDIWDVMRGNLRQRRVRLGIAAPSYDARKDHSDANYQNEVAAECRQSQRFTGPRPN